MQVLLVSPDRSGVVAARVNGRKRFKAPFPPLSILQVAAATPPDIEVSIQDEGVQDIDFDHPCDLVGITSLTSSAPRAYEISRMFRKRGVRTVLGGMHASACPEEALEQCDAVVIGEAEGVWPRLLKDAQQGRLAKIYRNDTLPDMSVTPPPRRDLVRRDKYLVPDTLQAGRGCPHNCTFCSVTTFFGRQVRSRPVESVIAEVGSLPGRHIVFVDDNLLMPPIYARRLLESLVGMGKKWLGQASTAVVENIELVKLAAKSGCQGLFIGLESLSGPSLKHVNKEFNAVSRFKDMISRLHDLGIGVIGAFMFGFDGEDESVFERTAEFAEKAQIDVPQYSILTPLPATPLYAQMEAEGRIIDRDWSHYDGGHVVFTPRGVNPEKLDDGLKMALRYSYSRLGIMRRLFGHWSSRLPLMLSLNIAFRRRAIPFAMGATR